jgi:hypothetical protein
MLSQVPTDTLNALVLSLTSILSSTSWSGVSALGSLLGAGAILYAARQFRFQAMMKAQELFNQEWFRTARSTLFARLDESPRSFSESERREALVILSHLDEFARLESYIGRRRLIQIWGDPLAKAWILLEPLMADERIRAHAPEKWDVLASVCKRALRARPHLRSLPCVPSKQELPGPAIPKDL